MRFQLRLRGHVGQHVRRAVRGGVCAPADRRPAFERGGVLAHRGADSSISFGPRWPNRCRNSSRVSAPAARSRIAAGRSASGSGLRPLAQLGEDRPRPLRRRAPGRAAARAPASENWASSVGFRLVAGELDQSSRRPTSRTASPGPSGSSFDRSSALGPVSTPRRRTRGCASLRNSSAKCWLAPAIFVATPRPSPNRPSSLPAEARRAEPASGRGPGAGSALYFASGYSVERLRRLQPRLAAQVQVRPAADQVEGRRRRQRRVGLEPEVAVHGPEPAAAGEQPAETTAQVIGVGSAGPRSGCTGSRRCRRARPVCARRRSSSRRTCSRSPAPAVVIGRACSSQNAAVGEGPLDVARRRRRTPRPGGPARPARASWSSVRQSCAAAAPAGPAPRRRR